MFLKKQPLLFIKSFLFINSRYVLGLTSQNPGSGYMKMAKLKTFVVLLRQ